MPDIIPYNRQAAVNYANKWAYRRNPQYYDYEDIGGDCTNFASQCLFAGSGVMNYEPVFGWYYIDANNKSPSWTGVEFLYNFLVSNRTRAVFAIPTSRDGVIPGDIIQLANENGQFYHTLFVTETVRGRIYVAAHSYNTRRRRLDTYRYADARFLHIVGVYI